jgi:uncharacterized repeat protein (TIGR03803 family)
LKRLWRWSIGALLLILLGTATALHAQSAAQSDKPQAGSYSLLYSFRCSPDGETPGGGLLMDPSGNLYGTTEYGGESGLGRGIVFKVTPNGTESVLHTFAGPPSDGEYPVASLTLDAAGNLYGTTPFGGESSEAGVVFKLTSTGTESIVYNFCPQSGCTDGNEPFAGVTRDSAGNLYGTTLLGGASGVGTVFKLTPDGTESVVHSFVYSDRDGSYPASNLTRDSSGNLYGTAEDGGSSSRGTVFKVTASGRESVLYSFKGAPSDGESPGGGGLLRDTAGNFYGATGSGGPNGNSYNRGLGVLFELTPGGAERVLLNFSGLGGAFPDNALARDEAGNLYGTALNGGSGAGCGGDHCGVLFELTPAGRETVLHNFTLDSSTDGANPNGVVRDGAGNLYGTLENGGAYGCGAVFKYTP